MIASSRDYNPIVCSLCCEPIVVGLSSNAAKNQKSFSTLPIILQIVYFRKSSADEYNLMSRYFYQHVHVSYLQISGCINSFYILYKKLKVNKIS